MADDTTSAPRYDTVAVIGAGAWGRALAQTAARAGRTVWLWDHKSDRAAQLQADRQLGLSGPRSVGEPSDDAPADSTTLHDAITVTGDLGRAVAPADVILLVTPAQTARDVTARIAAVVDVAGQADRMGSGASHERALDGAPIPLVLCAKGLCRQSGDLLSQALATHVDGVQHRFHTCALSGPSFAHDVAAGAPTAVTLACPDLSVGEGLARALSHPRFRCYWSADLIGVQVGGAIKNVLAIAAGIVTGAGLGASAHAALIARGFAEMTRIGSALGARPETLAGLSGLGDLVLTCSDPKSRNMSLGLAIGRTGDVAEALKATALSEGVATAHAMARLASTHDLDVPICLAVNQVLQGERGVHDAITALLDRPLRAEDV